VSGRRLLIAVTLALAVIGAAADAQAQGLGQTMGNALSNNCGSFGGTNVFALVGSSFVLVGKSSLGSSQLNALCAPSGGASTGNAQVSTGSVSVEERQTGTDTERRILQRLQERRDGRATSGASADMTGALRGLSFFVTGEYQSFDKETTSLELGYGRETWGTTFGADYAVGGLGILGLAFTYNQAKGFYDVGGGGFDIDTYGTTLYGSFFPVKSLFVDGYVGYNRKDYDSDRRHTVTIPILGGGSVVSAGSALGSTHADEFKAGLNLGYDFVVRNFTVGPRVGLNYRDTSIAGFTEHSAGTPTGLELDFLRQNQTSLTTVLGVFSSLAISTGFGVVVPQVTAEYVHEFEDDQKSHGFRFVQDAGATIFRFRTDPPDRDYFNVGAGVSVVLANGLVPFVNYRELLGYRHQTNHAVTAGLRFSF